MSFGSIIGFILGVSLFIIAVLMVIAMGTVFSTVYFNGASLDRVTAVVPGIDNTTELGKLLFTQYLYPFEIASLIFESDEYLPTPKTSISGSSFMN